MHKTMQKTVHRGIHAESEVHSAARGGSVSPWWRPTLWALIAAGLVLVIASAIVPLVLGAGPVDRTSPVRVFFDVAGERNLPTWWNTGLLWTAGALSVAIGLLRRPTRLDGRGGWSAWCGLGALLALMSLDEYAGIHERLDGLWRRLVGDNPLPAFEWLMLGVPVAGAVVLFLWVCARVLPSPSTALYVLGIVVFFLGALGAEALVVAAGVPLDSWAYVASYHVEELLEFTGSALLVVAPLAAVRLASGGRASGETSGPASGLELTWHAGRRRCTEAARPASAMR
ncbi:hypothetical protein [Citricoccus sp.]|uniref:hypothetical protein n=1 Tax=Citricoccus sp. TaxID=1978372 RepID=UPI0028BD523D|nr:hypothetical protein [Citricoccus sp.]